METQRYSISNSIAWQQEPTKKFVYINDIKNNYFYKLEDVAKEIWLNMAQGMNVPEICEALSQQFDASMETLEKDVRDFLTLMQFKEIILPL